MDRQNNNPTDSYGRHAARGGMWLLALKTAHRLLGMVRTVILARILSPDDFGIMGIAVLAISTLETFSKTGIEPALVNSKNDVRGHLDTAWTILVIRSVLLFSILYFGAPFVAGFFKTTDAVRVIRVLAFLELLVAAKNVGVVYFQRDLLFGRRFALEFAGLSANIVVSICLALYLRSVWALVWGSLAGAAATFVMSYVLHPYRPRFKLDFPVVRELVNFGRWIFLSNIIYFIVSQGDSAFVGKVLGIAALGFYQMANRLSGMISMEFRNMFFYVLFPVYSRMRDDTGRLKKAFIEVLHISNLVLIPITAGILVLARDFTVVFMGEKWVPMVAAMRVMAVAGTVRAVGSAGNVVYYALGKPRVETQWHAVRFVVMAVLIYPLSSVWNISGAACAIAVSSAVWAAGFIAVLSKDIGLGVGEFSRTFVYPLAGTMVMSAAVIILKGIMPGTRAAGFFAVVVISAVVYAGFIHMAVRFGGYGIYRLIGKRLKGALRG